MRRRLRLFRRPAAGQMVFWFILSPTPIYWMPPEPPQRSRPTPRRNVPSWRPRRARSDSRPSEDRQEWTINRLIRRHAACVLCGRWPAACDHRIRGRVMLVCRACESRPDTPVRLAEIAMVDWSATPDPVEEQPTGTRPSAPPMY
jgi:hypothetical protein